MTSPHRPYDLAAHPNTLAHPRRSVRISPCARRFLAMNIAAITRFKHGDLLETLQRLNWSQSELAKRTGIQAARISQYALLQYRPNPEDMERIQKAFGEADIFFDVEKAWPEHFHGTKKSLKVIQTREVDPSHLIGLTPEVLQLPAPDGFDGFEAKEALTQAIEHIRCAKHKRQILKLHFLEGFTQAECAEKTGQSRAYCNMVILDGLYKMRRWLAADDSGEHLKTAKNLELVNHFAEKQSKLMHFPEPVEVEA